MNIIKIFTFVFCFLFLTTFVQAATLYMDPSFGGYAPGDIFGIKIKIDTNINECINAGEINLSFPKEILQFEDFSVGESFFSLWIQRPGKQEKEIINKEGIFKLSGGVPGGYCGKIPGDPGDSNIIGEIFFKVSGKAGDKAKVNFNNNSQIFLNDGFGTIASLILNNGEYLISQERKEIKSELDSMIKNDKIPPEPFVIELNKDYSVYEGKYFVIFSTTDKQSGIDRYEATEIKLSDLKKSTENKWYNFIFKTKIRENWTSASSPYLLKDQTLNSIIKIKAIDKAGNERVVDYLPNEELRVKTFKISKLNILIFIGIIFLALIVVIYIKNKKIKLKEE